MKIDRVYISNYKGDVRFLRPCVASIRTWYPEIPITIIQDLNGGAYRLDEACAAWNLELYETEVQRFGSGWSRLEPLFHTQPERFLYLDADIVFTGRVIDELEQYDEEVVLTAQESRPDQIARHWFDLEKLAAFDPAFVFQGCAYNVGLFVANAGIVNKEDLEHLIMFSEPRRALHPEMLLLYESGPLNYVFLKKAQEGKLTIGVSDVMRFCPSTRMPEIELDSLEKGTEPPYALHWAGGMKHRPFGLLPNGHVLRHFVDHYHTRVAGGKPKQTWRAFQEQAQWIGRRLRRKVGLE